MDLTERWTRCRRCGRRVLSAADGLRELIPDESGGGVKARVASVEGERAQIELLFREHTCE